MKPFSLSTDRILLRAPEPKDIAVMLRFENDAEELEATSAATGPYSRYQMEHYIRNNTNDIFTDHELRYMIACEREGQQEVVGMVDVFNFDPRHRKAEVGILVSRPFRRQGIASEALRLVAGHCFQWIGMHQLYAYVRADNMPCLHLFLREGFVQAGRLQDWVAQGHRYHDVVILQKLG